MPKSIVSPCYLPEVRTTVDVEFDQDRLLTVLLLRKCFGGVAGVERFEFGPTDGGLSR
jgi:hypothetical protein